jgi:ABC-type Fe3+/spermidine/putrescine transport system ATPase subunit
VILYYKYVVWKCVQQHELLFINYAVLSRPWFFITKGSDHMKFLHVSGIGKHHGSQLVLDNIDLSQEKGQKIVIAGESGSGKSTLLKIIGGLEQPDTGQVLFDGERVPGPYEKLIPGHPHIAYLSQHFELRNNYRVEEILDYGNTLSQKESENLFDICHISHLLTRKTDQLSGGEKQRIALAKLLTTSPRLLLLDEPFSNLDMRHKQVLKTVIDRISERLQITCLLVSHDPQDILPWADEIIIMRAGKILQQGTPQQIYKQPVNAYAAGLFGKYNLMLARMVPGFENKGKYLVTRPEHVKLVAAGQGQLQGVVHKLLYLGYGWDIEVMVEQDIVTVRVNECTVAVGNAAGIEINAGEVWHW